MSHECRLDPGSRSLAAERKALIAEHEASFPLQLPDISMAVGHNTRGSKSSGEAPAGVSGPGLQTVPPVEMSEGSSTAASPAAPSAEGSAADGSVAAQRPSSQQAEYAPGAKPVMISSGTASVSEETSSMKAAVSCQAGSAQLSLAKGSAPKALSEPLQLEAAACSVLQSSAVQPPQTTVVAAPGTGQPLGSFLGKSMAEAPAARASANNEQLSTRQAQEVADAAAARTIVHKQTGALSVREGQCSSVSGEGMPSSAAAAVPNACGKVGASTLQPPQTSEHAPSYCVVCWGLIFFYPWPRHKSEWYTSDVACLEVSTANETATSHHCCFNDCDVPCRQ